jgi:hypothetical protein
MTPQEESSTPGRPERGAGPAHWLTREVLEPHTIPIPPPVRHLIGRLPPPDALVDVVPPAEGGRVEIQKEGPPPEFEDVTSMEMGSSPEGLTRSS